jgi:nucleotide-binding universal stress UspA family protein
MKVLVATDGSEHSMKAVRRALELAEKEGAQVTIISVAYYFGDGFDDLPPSVHDKLADQAKAALTKAKALFDSKGIKAETVLESGTVPANNIIRKAEEGKFDRIIMGSTGITGFTRTLMGSTAGKVVANAPCSVSIIR